MTTQQLFFLGSTMIFSPLAFAQSPAPDASASGTTLHLWPDGKMPGHGAKDPEKPAPPGGLIKAYNVSDPTIEVFKAPNTIGSAPAVIIAPGGAYALLAYKAEGTDAAHWLNTIGITGIVLKYRVPSNQDGAFDDIQRAVRVTRAHASEWGIGKVGVLGFSAGGHLAARLGNNYDKPAYPAIDDADKLSCRPDFLMLLYPGYLADTGTVRPDVVPTASMPPTFIAIAEDDVHHFPGSKIYDAALKVANVPEEYISYPTGGHGFGLHSDKAAKAWPADAAAWLHKIGIL